MEHIVQFGITIDDEVIKQNIEKSARDKVVEDVKKEIMNVLFVGNSWSRDLSVTSKEIVRNVLEEYKDTIIKDATSELVDTMKRSKKYKEALAKIVEATDE